MAAFALAALLWNGAASATDLPTAESPAPLCGTAEIHSNNLKMFPKWRGMLQLFKKELSSCGLDQCGKAEWQAVVDRLRGKDVMTQLRAINIEMNRWPYVTDQVNWNLPDSWATPLQFLQKGGDCEDFAIAKYMALRDLGVPIDDMRIVVLNDLNLRIAHAVLAVYVDADPTSSTTRSRRSCPRARSTTISRSIRSTKPAGGCIGTASLFDSSEIRWAKAKPRSFSERQA